MIGVVAGLLLSLVLQSPAPAPASPGLVACAINGADVPIRGSVEGGRLAWRVDDQAWSHRPWPGDARSISPSSLGSYRITVNGAPCDVRGWVDAAGVLGWAWAHQDVRVKPSAAGWIDPAGALANGVQTGPNDQVGDVRASDPETADEGVAVMEAGSADRSGAVGSNCDPDPFQPPPVGGGPEWGKVAGLAFLGFLVVGLVVVLVVLLASNGSSHRGI